MDAVRKMGGDEIVKKVKRPFGLNEEGESNNYWRDCGVPRLYFTLGNLSGTRSHSKYLALRKFYLDIVVHPLKSLILLQVSKRLKKVSKWWSIRTEDHFV